MRGESSILTGAREAITMAKLMTENGRLRALLDRAIPMVAADMRGQPLLDEMREALGSVIAPGHNR